MGAEDGGSGEECEVLVSATMEKMIATMERMLETKVMMLNCLNLKLLFAFGVSVLSIENEFRAGRVVEGSLMPSDNFEKVLSIYLVRRRVVKCTVNKTQNRKKLTGVLSTGVTVLNPTARCTLVPQRPIKLNMNSRFPQRQ